MSLFQTFQRKLSELKFFKCSQNLRVKNLKKVNKKKLKKDSKSRELRDLLGCRVSRDFEIVGNPQKSLAIKYF